MQHHIVKNVFWYLGVALLLAMLFALILYPTMFWIQDLKTGLGD